MRTVSGSKTFNNFQTFDGSQYFSLDLRKKDSLFIAFQKKEK